MFMQQEIICLFSLLTFMLQISLSQIIFESSQKKYCDNYTLFQTKMVKVVSNSSLVSQIDSISFEIMVLQVPLLNTIRFIVFHWKNLALTNLKQCKMTN